MAGATEQHVAELEGRSERLMAAASLRALSSVLLQIGTHIGAAQQDAIPRLRALKQRITAFLAQRLTLRLTALHPHANSALPDSREEKDAVCRAVMHYLQAARQARVDVGADTSATNNDVLAHCPRREPFKLFQAAPPPSSRIGSVKVDGKQTWQNNYSAERGRGYAAFPIGEDMLGAYDLAPVGDFLVLEILPPEGCDGGWSVHTSCTLELKTVECPGHDVLAVEDVGARFGEVYARYNDYRVGNEGPIPWHVVAAQCHKFSCFVQRHSHPLLPKRAPIPDRRHPQSGRTWKECVATLVGVLPCEASIALELLEDLVQGTDHSRAVTGFLMKGLPGSGKTAAARELAFAMGFRLMEPSIRHMQGGVYRGDASAALECVFARAHQAYGLFPVILDEIDLYTTQSSEGKCDEQIGVLLQSFTAVSKPGPLVAFAATNNDKAMLGAIVSRFCKVLVVPAPRFSFFVALFAEPAPGVAERVFVADVGGDCRAVVALACIGLTARDVFDVPRRDDVVRGRLAATLVAAAHRKKGNVFPAHGPMQSCTPWEVANHVAGVHGRVLRDFLLFGHDAQLLSGRMVLFPTTDGVYLDVELAVGVDVCRRENGNCHTIRPTTTPRCRCYGPMPLLDALWALQQLAKHIDASHFNFLTPEFLEHAAGKCNAASVDEKRAVSLGLVRDFCREAVQASVLFFPPHLMFVGSDATRSVANRGVEVWSQRLFVRRSVARAHYSIAYCTSESELATLRPRPIDLALSSVLSVFIAAQEDPFTCVRCGEGSIANDGVKGCLHPPAGLNAHLPESERASRLRDPAKLRYAVTMEADLEPYEDRYNPETFSFESVRKIRFNECGCEGGDVRVLTRCPRHAKGASVTIHKRAKREEIKFFSEDDRRGLQVGHGGVKAIRVCCGALTCSGEVGPCNVTTHVKPTLHNFKAPADETLWCPHCLAEQVLGRMHCVFCSRLLPVGCNAQVVNTLCILGEFWIDPEGRFDAVVRAVEGMCTASLDARQNAHTHVRDPGTKRCRDCDGGLQRHNDATSDSAWLSLMQAQPCQGPRAQAAIAGEAAPLLRGWHTARSEPGREVRYIGDFYDERGSLVLVEGVRRSSGPQTIVEAGCFAADGVFFKRVGDGPVVRVQAQ